MKIVLAAALVVNTSIATASEPLTLEECQQGIGDLFFQTDIIKSMSKLDGGFAIAIDTKELMKHDEIDQQIIRECIGMMSPEPEDWPQGPWEPGAPDETTL